MKKINTNIYILITATLLTFVLGVSAGGAEHKDIERSIEFYNIGTKLTERGDYAGAITIFKRSILFNQQNANAHAGLGWAYFSLTQFDKAKSHWHEAIEINPQAPAALLGTGYLHFMNEDFDAAIKTFKSLITQHPKSSSVHAALGRVYAKQGNIDDAITELQRSIDLNPNEKLSYWTLSEIYESMGELTVSKEYRNKALKYK